MLELLQQIHTNLVVTEQEAQFIEKVKRYSYWTGMLKWIDMLMLNCLICQTNNSARKDLNKEHLEPWGQ